MSDNRIMSLFVSDIAPDEQSIRNVAFKAILEGAAMTRDGLVTATGFSREKVDTLVDELIKRGLIVIDLDSGRIVGSWGLSLLPTTHKLRIRDRTLHTWCAEDAVGIPAGSRRACGHRFEMSQMRCTGEHSNDYRRVGSCGTARCPTMGNGQ
jgi:hypothetical protein